MRHTRYTLDARGQLELEATELDLYRYPDLTAQTAATFAWLERAIEDDLVTEAAFLRRYDQTVADMRDVIEMPDRKEQLFIELCRQNGGRLSERKRNSSFAELDDDQVAALEQVVGEAMGLS